MGLLVCDWVDAEAANEHAACLGVVDVFELLNDLVYRLQQLEASRPQVRLEVEAGLQDRHQNLFHLLVFVCTALRVHRRARGMLMAHLLKLEVEDLFLDLSRVFAVEGVLLVDDVVESAPERPDVHFLTQVYLFHDQFGGRVVDVAGKVVPF